MASQRTSAVSAPAPESKVALERIIGLTSLTNAAFSIDRTSGNLAYAAGAVLVVYSPRKARQVRFFQCSAAVHSVAFSPDGEHVAAGQRGRKPSIQVWSLATGALKTTLLEHSYGVAALAFSPDGRLLASAGFKNDRALHVWDWRADGGYGRRVATGKLSQRVLSLAWRADGGVLVTAGEKHLKFWPVEVPGKGGAAGGGGPSPALAPTAPVVTMASKPAVLSEAGAAFENFVDVCFGASEELVGVASGGQAPLLPSASTLPAPAKTLYAITTGGMLVSFDEGRLMEQWVHTRAKHGFSLEVSPASIFVGCSDGIVRAFAPGTLAFRGTLPSPAAWGQGNVSVTDPLPTPGADDCVPAALAVRCTHDGRHVSVIYGDKSLLIWDCGDKELNTVLKVRSMTGHAGPVWDIKLLPPPPPPLPLVVGTQGGSGGSGSLAPDHDCSFFPEGTFATASSDCTVRLWNVNPRASLGRKEAQGAFGGADGGGEEEGGDRAGPLPYARPRSVLMREQLRVLYVDEHARRAGKGERGETGGLGSARPGLRTIQYPAGSAPVRCIINAPFDVEGGGPGLSAGVEVGARSVATSSTGALVAVGDKAGNVAVFNMSGGGRCVGYETAHDAEVTALAFAEAPPLPVGTTSAPTPSGAPCMLLATASRDRFVHVFDVQASGEDAGLLVLRPVQTLPDHTSSVTCLAFTRDGSQLVTGGTDSQLVFHRVEIVGGGGNVGRDGRPRLARARSFTTPHGAVLDLDVDSSSRNLVAAGQDRRLHVWNLKTGKAVRSYRVGEDKSWGANGTGDEGAGVSRVALDPSGLYVAAACDDRSVRLLDFYTGSVVAKAIGHGDAVTGLVFTADCRRMLTTSVDGTVMVWRLSLALTKTMQARLAEMAAVKSGAIVAVPAALAAAPPHPSRGGTTAVAPASIARGAGGSGPVDVAIDVKRSGSVGRGGGGRVAPPALPALPPPRRPL